MPPSIRLAFDLEHERARPGVPTKTVDDISESVVLGGRVLRVTTTAAGGAPLRVAMIGRYAFVVARLETLVARVIAAERHFWHERDRQPFLITMASVLSRPSLISFGGTGRSDAFALWMDTGADMTNRAWLLAHEYFHTWNYRQLGRLGTGEALSY